MSLLLDALKKAAQQKAEKNREEASASGRSDETQLDGAADGDTATGAHDDSIPRAAGRAGEDETELDHSQLEARLERAQAQQPLRDSTDDTGLDVPDQTETEAAALASEQMQTGEDETIIFADEDVSEFMGEPEYVSRETRAPEDETDLSQRVDQNDLTDVRVPVESGVDVDETDLNELAHREDETEFQAPAASAD